MENEKAYEQLNEDTKRYLRTVLSYVDCFDKSDETEDYALPVASFLAGLYEEGFIKDYFESKGITYDKCIEYFKGIKPLEIKQSVDETLSFQDLDVSEILKAILFELKDDYYLEDTKVDLYDLEPYQLFDYMAMTYYDFLEEMMRSQFGIDDFYQSSVYNEYEGIREEKYNEFAKRFGVDIEAMIDDSELEEYNLSKFNIIFDNGKTHLILNENKDSITIPIQSNIRKEIKLGKYTQVLKINGENVTREVLEKFISSMDKAVFCQFTILEDDKEFTFTAFKEDMFGNVKINGSIGTPNLNKYGENLTEAPYIKDPSVGRDAEIRRMEQVLLYPERDKSIIITGDAGSGKTALVKGLAYRIQTGNVPEALKNLKIISIDTTTMVAGTKYVGTLEDKMKAILEEASKDKNIVIFIDEIHQTISGGKAEGSDNTVAEILKPYLDGKVRIIGATTTEEYAEHIEPNGAFKTRLKKIAIKEPSEKVTYEIINDLINAYNKISFSKFNFDEDSRNLLINWLIESTKNSARVYNDKASNPRLVLDIVKESYAIAALNNRTEIEIDDICEALMSEDRLYDSNRARQVMILKSSMKKEEEKPPRGIILEFKPRTKKD